jgi:hypothetical protein
MGREIIIDGRGSEHKAPPTPDRPRERRPEPSFLPCLFDFGEPRKKMSIAPRARRSRIE